MMSTTSPIPARMRYTYRAGMVAVKAQIAGTGMRHEEAVEGLATGTSTARTEGLETTGALNPKPLLAESSNDAATRHSSNANKELDSPEITALLKAVAFNIPHCEV